MVDDPDGILPVHKGRDFGHFRKTIFFLYAVDACVILHSIPPHPLGYWLYLPSVLIEEMPCAAGVVYRKRNAIPLLHYGFQGEGGNQETYYGHRGEKLPFALLNSLVEKPLEEIAKELVLLRSAEP